MHPDPNTTLGDLIRQRRTRVGITLNRLADLVGCAPSYLSMIEREQRGGPPSEFLIRRIEEALGFDAGELVAIARWQRTPPDVRREVAELQSRQRAAARLAELLRQGGLDAPAGGSLDAAYKSGELRRLVERVAGPEDPARPGNVGPLPRVVPMEVPLINSVAAGYPREFTDLGYPARVADEYVRTPMIDDPDAFAARVVGDSMAPDYREGDIVVFSPARPVTSGTDCFARIEPDHETTFKRVYFESGDDGRSLIRLQPLNSAYPPRVLRREDVAGLYAAVCVTRMLS